VTNLQIKTADEFVALDLHGRWKTRRTARETDLSWRILRTFLERGGLIPVEEIVAAVGDRPTDATHRALVALDDDDLIRIRGGDIDIAYPFSASPTPFVVRSPDGRERYACCATDALGIAPMAGQRVEIRSRCHHCGTLIQFSATPEGAESAADGHALDRKAIRRPVQGRRLSLNDDQLLPVGRTSQDMATGESDSRRSGSHRGGRFQARRARLRWASHWRVTMTNRNITVYWSTT
jgi:hypothetical protein